MEGLEEKRSTLYFAPEIIENILKRLHVKSLVRFSCVCKQWWSLIFSNPDFSRLHTAHAKRPTWMYTEEANHNYYKDGRVRHCISTIDSNLNGKVLGPHYKDASSSTNFSPITNPRILGSCDGLLLIGDTNNNNADPLRLTLWNPYVDLMKTLNTPKKISLLNSSNIHIVSGLGYDPTRDDYKAIVVLFTTWGGREQVSYMCSLRRNSWTQLSGCFPNSRTHELGFWSDKSATTLRGIPHWIAIECQQNKRKIWKIICFDPVTDEFGEVPLSEELCNYNYYSNCIYLRLGVLDGCICAVRNKEDTEVWAMKEYNVENSWAKLYTLKNVLRPMKPLGYSSKGDHEELILVNSLGYYWIFSVKDGTDTAFVTKDLSSDDAIYKVRATRWCGVTPYVESLSCPWLQIENPY